MLSRVIEMHVVAAALAPVPSEAYDVVLSILVAAVERGDAQDGPPRRAERWRLGLRGRVARVDRARGQPRAVDGGVLVRAGGGSAARRLGRRAG